MAAPGVAMHKHLPSRWDSADTWYFVTVFTRERYPYFESEEACKILMDACQSIWEKHRYRLGALVIMPDHWHALIKPKENEVIESIVGSIKQRVFHSSRLTCAAQKENNVASIWDNSPPKHGGAPKVIRWKKRFMDHRTRNEDDYLQHRIYAFESVQASIGER
jgi:putative transposase